MSRILPQYVQAYLVVVWLSIRLADTVRVTAGVRPGRGPTGPAPGPLP